MGWLLDWGAPSASPQSQPSFVVGPRALNYFRSGLLALWAHTCSIAGQSRYTYAWTWPWLMCNFNIQPNCSHLYFAHCLFLKCQVMPPIGTGISMFSDCNSRGINLWQKVQQIQGWCVGKPSVWWELVGFSTLNLCSLRSPSKTWANVSHHVSVWDSHYLTGYETQREFWMCPSVEVLRWRGRKPVCQCSTCRQGCPSPWWNLSDRTADTLKPFS